jgi:hypothetical protein
MIHRRYEGSSVVDEDDNLWVLGGTHDSKGSGSALNNYHYPNMIGILEVDQECCLGNFSWAFQLAI